MKLIWNGHSCFTLDTAQGCVVLDPYRDGSVPGLSPLHLTADLVLCSHEHRDHGAREAVELTGRPVSLQVEELHTFHDPEGGALRGPNTIHIVAADGLRVAHLGDLGCALTPEQTQRLRGLDALMIPVGGPSFGYDVIAPLEDYLALCGGAVVRYSGNVLELTKDTPAQTAVLSYCPT